MKRTYFLLIQSGYDSDKLCKRHCSQQEQNNQEIQCGSIR